MLQLFNFYIYLTDFNIYPLSKFQSDRAINTEAIDEVISVCTNHYVRAWACV